MRVVRPSAGAGDLPVVGDVLAAVQMLDELALVIGLKEASMELQRAGERVERAQERRAA